MADESILLQAVRCKKCGAPSYPDQKREGFFCPFCRTLAPWGATGKMFSSGIRYRHKPVDMSEDGCFKLGMTVVGKPSVNRYDAEEAARRFPRVNDRIAYCDRETYAAWENSRTVTFTCAGCGERISGRDTQNFFDCPSCRRKYTKASVLADGKYAKELVIGRPTAWLPREAIPFRLNRRQAEQAIAGMMRAYLEVFSGRDIAGDMDTLQAAYLPYCLCDLSLLAQAATERGSLLVYHGRVNWALPLSNFHDRYLMNALHPWDFGESLAFRPTLLEGEVRLVGVSGDSTDEGWVKMLLWDMPPHIKNAFSVHEARVDWTQDYLRLHNASIMLPVWFLDRKPLDPPDRNESTAKFAVNGQTGKVSCIIDASTEKERLIETPQQFLPQMSDESTLFSPPVPVVHKPGTYQYRPVAFGDALIKKPGLFARIFGGL